jgi:general secretion pathway protein G
MLELIAVIAIIALLAGILARQVLFYQERAEKAAMELVLSHLRTALLLRASAYLVKASPEDIKRLSAENPMEWLAEKPQSYAGEFFGEPAVALERGGWYFDRADRTLVYQLRRAGNFVPSEAGKNHIRFKVVAEYGELARIGAAGTPVSGVRRLAIEPLAPIRWFPAESALLTLSYVLR